MNIVFDHQIFCLQKYGGISRYFFELANHISRFHEDQVEIFAPFHLNAYLSEGKLAFHKGRAIPSMNGVGRYTTWAADTALAYLSLKTRLNVDILHETYFSAAGYCPSGAKRIVTVHDMVHEIFRDQFPSRDRLRKMKARAVKRADHVICVSENTRRDLIRILAVPEEKISVVHHGYSLWRALSNEPPVLEKPFILFVGKRDGYKNFLKLLRAYAQSFRLKEELSLVCFGGGQFTIAEESAIKYYGLATDQVFQITGEDDVLMKLYMNAALFVYPSLYEGFGIPLLEAMSLGCPIACSNASAFPEVTDQAAELFDPTEEDDIQRALEKVVFSASYRDALIKLGLERSRKFSLDRCVRQTLQVYLKCTSQKT